MIRLAQEGKRIRVVDDQVLAPTYTRDLAEQIRDLLQARDYGLYHVTNSGQCSWFEFAGKIFEILSMTPDFGSVSTAEYGATARRPAWSVLSQDKITALGLKSLRPWPEALRAYLRQEGYLA
jgi:dTDP-4-dehydrorhamnose reductase